mgnify:CR=1 FL=1
MPTAAQPSAVRVAGQGADRSAAGRVVQADAEVALRGIPTRVALIVRDANAQPLDDLADVEPGTVVIALAEAAAHTLAAGRRRVEAQVASALRSALACLSVVRGNGRTARRAGALRWLALALFAFTLFAFTLFAFTLFAFTLGPELDASTVDAGQPVLAVVREDAVRQPSTEAAVTDLVVQAVSAVLALRAGRLAHAVVASLSRSIAVAVLDALHVAATLRCANESVVAVRVPRTCVADAALGLLALAGLAFAIHPTRALRALGFGLPLAFARVLAGLALAIRPTRAFRALRVAFAFGALFSLSFALAFPSARLPSGASSPGTRPSIVAGDHGERDEQA